MSSTTLTLIVMSVLIAFAIIGGWLYGAAGAVVGFIAPVFLALFFFIIRLGIEMVQDW